MARNSSLTVRAQADYPFVWSCLYCGAENSDRIHFDTSQIRDVSSPSSKQHGIDLAQAEIDLRAEMLAGYDRSIETTRADVDRFAAFWKDCREGVRPAAIRSIPMPMGHQCKCRFCQKLQPYDPNRYLGGHDTAFMLSLVVAVMGICAAVFLLLISLTRQDDAGLMRIIALCAGAVGLAALPVCVKSGKRAKSLSAEAQFAELSGMDCAPEKLPRFAEKKG
ncbi:MAG: hypothetical protein IKE30_04430 [Clostridia bacterium]|nr:hypothetical protein [Clostridia bacterium]